MDFVTAIRTCLRKYFTFRGRASRPEFWWFALLYFTGGVVLSFLDAALFRPNPETGLAPQYFSPFWSLILYLPLLTAAWRRLHDSGRPGWYALLPMFISFITLIGVMVGVLTFSGLAQNAADPETLRQPAAWAGQIYMVVAIIAQTVATIFLIYWLTRPSQAFENAWGLPETWNMPKN